MSNLHGIPDLIKEAQAHDYDLLPACIIATSGLTTPGSGLTLTAVSAQGYVRLGTALSYVDQPAISVAVSSTAGNHWVALTADTWTTIGGWTRRAGSHFVEQANATQPAAPDGAQLVAQVVVTGANITAVTPVLSPPLSRQNANAVAITGGTATGLAALAMTSGAAALPFAHIGNGGTLPPQGSTLLSRYPKALYNGIVSQPNDNDTGGGAALLFINTAATAVGSITTTGSATAYNTSSDARLKHAIAPLAGALDAVRVLRPVRFLWNADGSPGVGFLAHELMRTVPDAVTGEPDAVHEDGSVRPQQVDHSKLVPWLTAALQETLAQLDAVTARVAALETALGL